MRTHLGLLEFGHIPQERLLARHPHALYDPTARHILSPRFAVYALMPHHRPRQLVYSIFHRSRHDPLTCSLRRQPIPKPATTHGHSLVPVLCIEIHRVRSNIARVVAHRHALCFVIVSVQAQQSEHKTLRCRSDRPAVNKSCFGTPCNVILGESISAFAREWKSHFCRVQALGDDVVEIEDAVNLWRVRGDDSKR